MGDRSPTSLLDTLRTRLANRRSHSTPPDAEAQGRLSFQPNAAAVGYHAVPSPGPRVLPSNTAQEKPPFATPASNTGDPYTKYDPRAYRTAPPEGRNMPRGAMPPSIPKSSTPLLQLPRPRATWRRSLEDLSPSHTQRAISWHEGDLRSQRMTVDLACALPPDFLDLPPKYDSIGESSHIQQPQSWAAQDHSLDGSGSPGYNTKHLPRIVAPEPYDSGISKSSRGTPVMLMSPSPPVTVDTLLQHPLLR